MVKKLILLGFIGLFLGSCSPEVADNKRLTFSGRVIDSIGNPIPDLPIWVYGYEYHVGKTSTDQNGIFDFVSLEVSSTTMTLMINPHSSFIYSDGISEYNPQWGSYFFYIDPIQIQRDFKLGDIVLEPAASFELRVMQGADPTDKINWEINYKLPIKEENLKNPDEGFGFPTGTYASEDGQLDAQHPETGQIFYGESNSLVHLRYSINQGAWHTVQIPLTDLETYYEITY